jgi:LAO/AO transport system kinase
VAAILEAFERGERRALSRAISWIEGEVAGFESVYDRLSARVGRARRLGITGPPGAGKSTLGAALAAGFVEDGQTVGIVAVDPSSAFTGGALLGDRIRMGQHALDPRVFIRSMATRGSLGGLARRTLEVADLIDAFGFQNVLIETVGAGQIEQDVVDAADLCVVVLHPSSGDGIQAMKAGVLEAADLFVVNKADLPGAERLQADLQQALELRRERREVPIVLTVATDGQGLESLRSQIGATFARLEAAGELASRRADRRRLQVQRILQERLQRRLAVDCTSGAPDSGLPPYAAADALLRKLLGGQS